MLSASASEVRVAIAKSIHEKEQPKFSYALNYIFDVLLRLAQDIGRETHGGQERCGEGAKFLGLHNKSQSLFAAAI